MTIASFDQFSLSSKILQALLDQNFTLPTEVQSLVIPHALNGKNVCAIAQTGSGKTAAYLIPLLQKFTYLRQRARLPQALILVPTRELAQQVEETYNKLAASFKLKVQITIGGESPLLQERAIKKGVHILISTPGRLLDHYERGNIVLHHLNTFVIDEADRMLDMGFMPDIERLFTIVKSAAPQVMCFSATLPAEIKRLINTFIPDAVHIQTTQKVQTASTIDQYFVVNKSVEKEKRVILRALLKKKKITSAIIFANRIRDVDIIATSLSKRGFKASAMHGELAQSQRKKTLDRFKAGEIDYLVASDLAARGIDIQEMPCVINYDIPFGSDEYVHRVGRTGRAGQSGVAYSFIDSEKDKIFLRIKEFLNTQPQFIYPDDDLIEDIYSEMGLRKPTTVRNFSYPDQSPVGFGPDTPRFMKIKLN